MNSPIRIKKIRPGDDTDTYCGRCKAERAHQVVALNADGAPASVICRTCGGQHRYHPKKEPAAARTSAGGTARKAGGRAAPAREEPTGPLRPYSPQGVYAEGEWVEHPKFGQGRVAQARGGKIEVRFESGSRLLVHAG
jgi:hypothetical protein